MTLKKHRHSTDGASPRHDLFNKCEESDLQKRNQHCDNNSPSNADRGDVMHVARNTFCCVPRSMWNSKGDISLGRALRRSLNRTTGLSRPHNQPVVRSVFAANAIDTRTPCTVVTVCPFVLSLLSPTASIQLTGRTRKVK